MRARRGDRRHLAVGVAGFFGKNADHYRGDVVVAAVDVCFLDQRIDYALGLGPRKKQLLDASVIDHAGEAIAGEKERVADSGVAVEYVGLDFIRHADAAGNDVALRMTPRLLRSQQSRVDLLLDEGMCLGE